jgi:acetolactate decarboxylase
VAKIWQNAPAILLEQGSFDGLTPISQARRHGDFGVGAFDQLDGELIVLDGVFYQAAADGKTRIPPDSTTLAFCMLTRFGGTDSRPLPAGLADDGLTAFVDEALGPADAFFSLRVEGSFSGLEVRCLGRQTKPFRPLGEIEHDQPVYTHEQADGTMVGFRAPEYAGHLSPPADHLHFVSADRTYGGHVESFTAQAATLTYERIEGFEVLFP